MIINGETIAFAVFAIMAIVGGVGVAALRNLFHAALSLLVALFGVAGLFVLLAAPFLAMVQILVYMGAIAILIIFVIMLTQRVAGMREQYNRQWILSGLVALVVFGVLLMVISQLGTPENAMWNPSAVAATLPDDAGVAALGADLVDANRYVLPFEVAGLLMTVALIGAIAVARED
ncbi:MAG: NADH-quinone oxidoreductase subunit J [Anaerolineae bacterium]|nr:NADH-quinone oxidoreductase subunit J [Anaerolineae bacterium]